MGTNHPRDRPAHSVTTNRANLTSPSSTRWDWTSETAPDLACVDHAVPQAETDGMPRSRRMGRGSEATVRIGEGGSCLGAVCVHAGYEGELRCRIRIVLHARRHINTNHTGRRGRQSALEINAA